MYKRFNSQWIITERDITTFITFMSKRDKARKKITDTKRRENGRKKWSKEETTGKKKVQRGNRKVRPAKQVILRVYWPSVTKTKECLCAESLCMETVKEYFCGNINHTNGTNTSVSPRCYLSVRITRLTNGIWQIVITATRFVWNSFVHWKVPIWRQPTPVT